MKEKTLESKVIFEGKVIKVRVDKVQLPDGSLSEREIVERLDGVSILPITADYKVLLIKQYRHAIGKVIYRLPGGSINKKDKSPEEAAQRELFEELGYKAKKLDFLFDSGGSGTIKQTVYHYLATGLYVPNEERLKDNELLEIFPTDLNEAVKMALEAQFPNPAFSLMILMVEDRLNKKAF
ncbi:NUDIX hydrolase [Candidatus Woesearchaeota archaeon]|nr:NUDIX hydrolase [Candidatus Woesearchaeota archaeon]